MYSSCAALRDDLDAQHRLSERSRTDNRQDADATWMVILRKRVAGLSESALERFVARAKRAARLRGTVNVLVTTSHELRVLNRRFRGKDGPTDVLSFPPIFGLVKDFAGDIAISADIAAQNARQLGHSAADEVRILTLHGVLHLAGYDHERDRGEMASREERLRNALGVPTGLIARKQQADRESLNRRVHQQEPRRARSKSKSVGTAGGVTTQPRATKAEPSSARPGRQGAVARTASSRVPRPTRRSR